MPDPVRSTRVAEALGAFSFASDLAFGLQFEDGARSCYMAMRLASLLGLPPDEQRDVYYTALFKDAGCTCWTSPMAAFLQADEIAARRELMIFGDPQSPRFFLSWMLHYVASDLPAHVRLRHLARVFFQTKPFMEEGVRTACDVSVQLAARIGMPEGVQDGVANLLEQWNGKGLPDGRAGEDIPRVARVVQLTFYLSPGFSRGGREAAVQIARNGRGRAFDPAIVDAFLELARDDGFWEELEAPDPWSSVLEMEPAAPHAIIEESALDDVAGAIADFTDLKSPYTAAHSRRVADLAVCLARRLDAPDDDIRQIRRAALMHDIGLVAVPSYVLNRPEQQRSLAEQERIRLHPYYGERILSHVPAFAGLVDAIGGHHERWDGSGYFRQLGGEAIPAAARLIAVADRFDELTHDRAAGAAMDPAGALAAIAADRGAYAPEALAVLQQEIGDTPVVRPAPDAWPAGLTNREVEVLRLAARGLTRRQIADELVVSEHTVRHHLEHIYGKTGASTRVGAVLWAMEHDLLP